jgi:DNA polymerase V
MVCTEIPFEQEKQRWATWVTSTTTTSRRRCWSAATVKLAAATADPVILTKAAVAALERLIVDGVPYARAGIMLTDLSPVGAAPQLPVFTTAHEEKHIGALLGDIMDRFGTSSIGLGRAGMVEAPDGA